MTSREHAPLGIVCLTTVSFGESVAWTLKAVVTDKGAGTFVPKTLVLREGIQPLNNVQ